MAGGRRRGNGTRVTRRSLLLLLAGVWLALAFAALLSVRSGVSAHGLSPLAPPSVTVPVTVPVTFTPPDATATPIATGTPTATSAATDTPAPVATQPGSVSGPQPTKVSFAQPTIGASGSGGPISASGGITSSGLLIAALLSCGVTIMGVIIAAIALTKLLRGGYGPFLKNLVLYSKRRMKRQGRRGVESAAEPEYDGWDSYEYDDSREWSARDAGRERRPAHGGVSRGAPHSYGSARERR